MKTRVTSLLLLIVVMASMVAVVGDARGPDYTTVTVWDPDVDGDMEPGTTLAKFFATDSVDVLGATSVRWVVSHAGSQGNGPATSFADSIDLLLASGNDGVTWSTTVDASGTSYNKGLGVSFSTQAGSAGGYVDADSASGVSATAMCFPAIGTGAAFGDRVGFTNRWLQLRIGPGDTKSGCSGGQPCDSVPQIRRPRVVAYITY